MNEEWNEAPKNPEDCVNEPVEEPVRSETIKDNIEEEPQYEQASGSYTQEPKYESYQFTTPVSPIREEKVKKEHKTENRFAKKLLTCVVLALVFGLVSGLVFQAVALVGNKLTGTDGKSAVQIQTTETVEQLPAKEDATDSAAVGATVKDVAKSAMPSVVAITSVSVQEIPNYFGFGSQQYEGQSSGSGIIVGQNETELLIATNNHVVADATSLTVLFAGQETGELTEEGTLDTSNAVNAQIKGTDAENDLAVISVRIEDIPADIISQIKVCQIGNSEEMEVGDQVVAIGNALGYGQSVTAGYVSAMNRKVTIDNMTSDGLIQTDAAINPGNSGGALLNMKGELVGINSAKYAANSVEGMGYAIPVSTAEPILNELMSRETRYKVDEDKAAYIGISCKSVTEELSQVYDMPVGVLISELEENGPAHVAGLQRRDIITKMDGQTISTAEELIALLEYYEAGEVVEFEIYRTDEFGDFTAHTISVTLGNKKDMTIDSEPEEKRVLPWEE